MAVLAVPVLGCPPDVLRASLSFHDKGIQLIPVGIAEIAGVDAAAAVAGRTLVTAAVGERDVIQPLDLRIVSRRQRDHDAVAHGRGITIERPGDADPGSASRLAPGDELLVLHHPADTQLAA